MKTIVKKIKEGTITLQDLTKVSTLELLNITEDGISLFELLYKKNALILYNLKDSLPSESNDYIILASLLYTYININFFNIEVDNNELISQKENYEMQYFNNRYSKKKYMNEISQEAIWAIEAFKNTMNTGEKSDPELIELACAAFIEQFANNNAYAMTDLYSVINIKEQTPNFCFKKSTSTSFNLEENTLYLSSCWNIDALNHEITHAIHWHTNKYAVPENFKLPYNFSENQLKKIYEYAKRTKEKLDNIQTSYYKELCSNNNSSFPQEAYFNYMQQLRINIAKTCNNSHSQKELFNYLLANCHNLSKEAFNLIYNINKNTKLIPMTTEININVYVALETIFDALSNGNFNLNDTDHKVFIGGHSPNYYNNYVPKIFAEIIAEYVTIIKSPQAKELIDILTEIMGQEFVDMLQNFYENMYIDKKNTHKSHN